MSLTVTKQVPQIQQQPQRLGRPIWTGAISFGLVTIPAKLYTVSSSHDLKTHLTCPKHPNRIHMRRWCDKCQADYSYDDVDQAGRLIEVSKNTYVHLSRREMDTAVPETNKTLAITSLAKTGQINPLLFETTHYILPDPKLGTKSYSLLVQALRQTGYVGIGKIAIRDRESLAILYPVGDVLVVSQASFLDEFREPSSFELDETNPEELSLAIQLLNQMANHPLDLSAYHDTYQDSLKSLVDQKVTGKTVDIAGKPVEAQPTKSLMDALRASIQKNQAVLA